MWVRRVVTEIEPEPAAVIKQKTNRARYVTGDCGAVEFIFDKHPTSHAFPKGANGHGYSMPHNGSVESMGLDTDCNGGGVSQAVGTAADQSAALGHLFGVQMRLGRFDPLEAPPYCPSTALALP